MTLQTLTILISPLLLISLAGDESDKETLNIQLEPEIQMNEILKTKPIKDFTDLSQFDPLNKFLEVNVGGEIYDLEPFVVKPRQTLEQKISADLQKNIYRFLTPKGLVDECLDDLPGWDVNFLNRFTIPFFGVSPEVRAAKIAKRRQWQRYYHVKSLIKEAQRDFYPEECIRMIVEQANAEKSAELPD